MSRRLLIVAVAGALVTACDAGLSLEADPRPIPLDLISGVPVTMAVVPGREPFRIVIDTAAPITALDLHDEQIGVGAVDELRIGRPDDPRVIRAILHDFTVARTPLYQVGTSTPVAVAGVLGGDLLSHYSVRFSYADAAASMTFTERGYDEGKPESDEDLARAGLAVVRTFVLGGGSYELGDQRASYGGSRLIVPACAVLNGRAIDMSLLVATGYGPLVLGRSAAARVLGRPIAEGEVDRLYVPGSPGGLPIQERGVLLGPDPGAFAIVGDEHGSSSAAISDFGGPCTQLFRHQTLEGLTPEPDCPTPAVIGVGPGEIPTGAAYVQLCANAEPLEYAVIADEEPLLSSVRNELRPYTPEIDGFAGTEVLKHFITELNYSNNRVILACADDAPSCVTRNRTYFPGARP